MKISSLDNFIRKKLIAPLSILGKPKIFCIGMNKTGTTSLKRAFLDLGYIVGNQADAEKLLPFFKNHDFTPIYKYINSAQVFQDIPFSLPKMYSHLCDIYPDAYYILSVRDNPKQWVESIKSFHTRLFGEGRIPSKEQLKASEYAYPGFIWDALTSIANIDENDPYNEKILIDSYEDYNKEVIEFFSNRELKFLKINLSEKDSYNQLIKFLGITSPFDKFPWENKTSEIK